MLSQYIHKKVPGRHENVNYYFKKFNVLSKKFRHDLAFHAARFHAVAWVVQFLLATDQPIYDHHKRADLSPIANRNWTTRDMMFTLFLILIKLINELETKFQNVIFSFINILVIYD